MIPPIIITRTLDRLAVESPDNFDLYAREPLSSSFDGMLSFLDEANRRIGRRPVTFKYGDSIKRVIFTYRSGSTTSLAFNVAPDLRLAFNRNFIINNTCDQEHGYHLEVLNLKGTFRIFVRLVRTGVRGRRKVVFRRAYDLEYESEQNWLYGQVHGHFVAALERAFRKKFRGRQAQASMGVQERVLETIME